MAIEFICVSRLSLFSTPKTLVLSGTKWCIDRKTKPTSIFSCLTFSLCVKPRVKSDSRGRYLSLCRRLTFIKQFHRHPSSSSQKSSRHRVLQPSYIRYAVFWPFFHHSLRILVKLCPSSHPLSISVIVTWLRPNLILILFCFCLLK